MAGIICGPVVGLVTSTTAKVLLEIDETKILEMILKDPVSGKIHPVSKELVSRVPAVFGFIDLTEKTDYDILVPDISDTPLGHVHTFPEDITSIVIAAVSCDRPESRGNNKDMWEVLYKKATQDNVDLVLHMGDNVYIDGEAFKTESTANVVNNDDVAFDPDKVDQSTAYIKARAVLRGVEKPEWDSKKDEILEIYRSRYRQVWTLTFKAKLLANFSNLMILDDHDIRDDIGLMDQDSDPESREFFLGCLALQVYHEYQRQLWDADVLQKSPSLESEYCQFHLGPLTVTMTDARMPQSLYKPHRQSGDDTYFGQKQMKDLLQTFQSNDDKSRMHLLVFTLPLVFMKKQINQILGDLNITDELGNFINVRHSKDLVPILDALHQWQTRTGPSGDILLLAGDLHIAGFTDIYKKIDGKENLVCHQVTTSAIANQHNKLYEYATIRALMNFTESYGDYSYRHYDWVNKCNFATIKISFTDSEKLSYTVELVNEDGIDTRDSVDKNWDEGVQTCTCECCNIS